jgi:hypothetical protein
MPETDLSPVVPPDATWAKMHYQLEPTTPGAELTARLWSGGGDAVTIKGPSGEVFIRLRQPQRLSYSKPNGVILKLKVVAYKTGKREQ